MSRKPRHYLDLFSPETYEAFSRSQRDVSGFRISQKKTAERIRPGDRLVCYMTSLSRWVGILETEGVPYVDDSPLFFPDNDPFVVRFKVRPLVWLPKEKCLPIHESKVWDALSFTKGTGQGEYGWTGILRRSLNQLDPADGEILETLLREQEDGGQAYPLDEKKYHRLVNRRIRRENKTVPVTVPADDDIGEDLPETEPSIRESSSIQALLARIGEQMGFSIWIPKNDRKAVLQEWEPPPGTLLDHLPLNYDEVTLDTVEQIDVLWLRGRAIARAFEVEHTTAVYSGILRMADLLALQPNMDIRLHIVAPPGRQQKVFNEIQRPVFSLLDRGPLAEYCTFLSYDSLRELASSKHLSHLSDSVLEDYEEQAE